MPNDLVEPDITRYSFTPTTLSGCLDIDNSLQSPQPVGWRPERRRPRSYGAWSYGRAVAPVLWVLTRWGDRVFEEGADHLAGRV